MAIPASLAPLRDVQRFAIAIALYPVDPTASTEIQRAPDDGTLLAPNTAQAVTLPRVPGFQPYYVDDLPNDGALRWYRIRAVRDGQTASAWTGWVAAYPQAVSGMKPIIPPGVTPTVQEQFSETPTVGTLTLLITDPQWRVTLVEMKTKSGNGAETAYAAVAPTSQSPVSAYYQATVALVEKQVSRVTYRVTGYDAAGTLRVLAENYVPFGVGAVPLPPVLAASVDANGNVSIVATGDSDTASVRLAASKAAYPSSATVRAAAAGNGRVTQWNNVLQIALGESCYVAAYAYSGANGTGQESPVLAQIKIDRSGTATVEPPIATLTTTATSRASVTVAFAGALGAYGVGPLEYRWRVVTESTVFDAVTGWSAWNAAVPGNQVVARLTVQGKIVQLEVRDTGAGNITGRAQLVVGPQLLGLGTGNGYVDRTNPTEDGKYIFGKGSAGATDDLDGLGEGTLYKRITAAGKTQLFARTPSNGQNLLPNPGFEDGSAFWRLIGAAAVTDSTKANSGNGYMQVTAAAGAYASAMASDESGTNVRYFEVNPGDVVQFGAMAYRESGDANMNLVIAALDKDKANPSFYSSPAVTAAAWTATVRELTIPAGKKFIYVYAQVGNNGTVPTVGRYDDLYLKVLRKADDILPGNLRSGMADATSRPVTGFFDKSGDDLDDLNDGLQYGRALKARLNGGKPWIDFSEAIHTGKHLGNIPDDGTSDRKAVTAAEKTGAGNANTHLDATGVKGSALQRSRAWADGLYALQASSSDGLKLQTGAKDFTNRVVTGLFDKSSDDLDDVDTSISLAKTVTANEKTGAARAYPAIDNTGVLNTTALDLSRGYTGKHLGNIPDDAASDRKAVTAAEKTGAGNANTHLDTTGVKGAALQRNRAWADGGYAVAASSSDGLKLQTGAKDFTNRVVTGLFDKSSDDLDDVDTSISLAKTVSATEKNGAGRAAIGLDSSSRITQDIPVTIKPLGGPRTVADIVAAANESSGSGQNLADNGSFEVAATDPADSIAAGWYVQSNVGGWTPSAETNVGFIRNGSRAIKVAYPSAATVPANTDHYIAYLSRRILRVREGELYKINIGIYAAASIAAPAGITRSAWAWLRVSFSDGTVADVQATAITATTTGFTDTSAIVTIPNPPSGKIITGAQLWFWARVSNTTGAPITMPAGALWDVRFDGLELIRVIDGSTEAVRGNGSAAPINRILQNLSDAGMPGDAFKADDGSGNPKSYARGGITGTCRHYIGVTFPSNKQYVNTPAVVLGGGGALARPENGAWGTESQVNSNTVPGTNTFDGTKRTYDDSHATNVSRTGFTPRLLLRQKATITPRTADFPNGATTVDGVPCNNPVTAVSGNSGVAVTANGASADGRYTVNFDVSIVLTYAGAGPGNGTLVIAIDADPNGTGAWQEVWTGNYTGTVTAISSPYTTSYPNEAITVSVAGMTTAGRLRLRVKSLTTSAGVTGTFSVLGHRSTDTPHGVTYNTSSGDKFASRTPDSDDAVDYTAIEAAY